MIITDTIRKAYAEVSEFIELLPIAEKKKIPQELIQIFNEKKDNEYIKNIKPNVSIKEQNLLPETLAIIAMLNLNYICEDENEKIRLRKIYENNEKIYKDLFQIDFDFDKVFETKKESNILNDEQAIITLDKETFFTKILNKIKKFFKK